MLESIDTKIQCASGSDTKVIKERVDHATSSLHQQDFEWLLQSLDGFLDDQINDFVLLLERFRPEDILQSANNHSNLQEERQQFEIEKTAEMQRLEQGNKRLISAWQELEAEKRKLLTQPSPRHQLAPTIANHKAGDAARAVQDDGPMELIQPLNPGQRDRQSSTSMAQIELIKRQMALHSKKACKRS